MSRYTVVLKKVLEENKVANEQPVPENPETGAVATPEGDQGPAPAAEAAPVQLNSASEGVHPLAVSSEEGLFGIEQAQMVSKLQKLLSLKYEKIIAYTNYGDRLRAHFRDSIHAHFQEHVKDEQRDVYTLAMKITALGGEPSPKLSSPADVGQLHHMFMVLLDYEKKSIALEREIATAAGENIALKAMAEGMALSDSHHADDTRRMLLCES